MRRLLIFSMFAIIGGTTLAVATTEFALYNFGGVEDVFVIPDRTLGWRLRPGAAGWVRENGWAWRQLNADGWRDRDHAIARPPRTVRVAVLGDSYIQAMNVTLEDSFPARLEARLNDCLRPTGFLSEVLSFGVSGYGTAQELLAFENHAAAFQPDIVITVVYFGNDIHDNYLPFDGVPSRPYFVLHDGKLQLDASFHRYLDEIERQPARVRGRQWLTARLRSARMLYSSWATLRSNYWPVSSRSELGRLDDDHDALAPPTHDPEFAKAWLVTEALLVKLTGEIAERGAEPWMVTGSISDQVVPDVRHRRALESALGVSDLYYPERRIDDVLSARSIATINLAQPFADYAAAHNVFLHGPMAGSSADGAGHWNELAHRLAADIVSDRLCGASERLRRVTQNTSAQSDR